MVASEIILFFKMIIKRDGSGKVKFAVDVSAGLWDCSLWASCKRTCNKKNVTNLVCAYFIQTL